MTLNIDQLKKKIIYRSNYRGTKEMDKTLNAAEDTLKKIKKFIKNKNKIFVKGNLIKPIFR